MTLASFVDLLRCPASGQPLTLDGGHLLTPSGRHRYPILDDGIPAFAEQPDSPQALQQRDHYDRIATAYCANLGYPHTIAYMAYLDDCLRRSIDDSPFGVAAEL